MAGCSTERNINIDISNRIAAIPDNFKVIEEQTTKKTLTYKGRKIGCVYTQQERDAFLYGVEMTIELVLNMLEKVNGADRPLIEAQTVST